MVKVKMVKNYYGTEKNYIISKSKEEMITKSLEIAKDALSANKDMSIIFGKQDILFRKSNLPDIEKKKLEKFRNKRMERIISKEFDEKKWKFVYKKEKDNNYVFSIPSICITVGKLEKNYDYIFGDENIISLFDNEQLRIFYKYNGEFL
jgi:hypothetical protein